MKVLISFNRIESRKSPNDDHVIKISKPRERSGAISRGWFLSFLIGNLRAYGGCLDSKKVMKDVAWRRYASGRCLATFDPEMSEWGNPSRVISGYLVTLGEKFTQ